MSTLTKQAYLDRALPIGAAFKGLSGPAVYALAALPLLAGGTAGYSLAKLNQPERQDFRNLGKEQLLAEIKAQIADTQKLTELRQERKEARTEGSTDIGQTAAREKHIA